MTTRVLVLGGRGDLGRRAVAALGRLDGVAVTAASRRDGLDLADPATLGPLDDHDVVVDCADTLRAPPDHALARCVASGRLFLEAGAHAPTLARLAAADVRGPGAAVLGIGLFPGISNLLARAVLDASGARAVELGIMVSPLSGAGRGGAALMADGLTARPAAWRGGAPVALAPLARGPVLPFATRARRTYAVDLPEPAMLHASTGADVAAWAAVAPAVMAPMMRLSAWAARGPRWWSRLVGGAIGASMRLVRSVILRRVPGTIELTAVAGDRLEALRVRRGLDATAIAIAAAIAALRERPPPPGVHLPDQVLTLDDQLARMRALGAELSSRSGP